MRSFGNPTALRKSWPRRKYRLRSFYLTEENVDDRNPKHIKKMTEELFWKMYADKGYLQSTLANVVWQRNTAVHQLKKNMKGHIMELRDKILLRKRTIIESVNDELKNMCLVEHTGRRSINGFIMNMLSALTTYCFSLKSPLSISIGWNLINYSLQTLKPNSR